MSQFLPLIAGLVLFVGGHLVSRQRDFRAALIDRLGAGGYKGLYSLVSLLGLVLIVYGFGVYRAAGYIQIWQPPRGMAHLALPLVWLAFVLLVAGRGPAGFIVGKAKHPMLLAVKLWAFAHLLANGDLGSILLFGSFLAWGVYARIALKRAGDMGAAGANAFGRGDIVALLVGTVLTLAFVFGLHQWLIGVAILAV